MRHSDLPSPTTTSMSSTVRWLLAVSTPIDGLAIFETYIEQHALEVGARWWRCTSTRSQTTVRCHEVGSIQHPNRKSPTHNLTDHALSRWSRQYLDGLQPYKNPRAPLQLSTWMRSAGFTEVDTRLIPLPMCGWSSSEFLSLSSIVDLCADSDRG